MRKSAVTIAAVAVFSLCFVSVPGTSSEAKAADDTGSIKGTISAKRVRSPKNVLVYVEKAAGKYAPPKDGVRMDQKKLEFIPQVLPIVKGTKVKFLNSDPILHNVFWIKNKDGSYPARNLGTWGKGGVREFTFDKLGHVTLLCNVHPEMESHVVVLENPFFAVVGKDGKYELKDLPPGKYTVKTWYSKPKKLKSKSAEVTVKTGEATELDFALGRK